MAMRIGALVLSLLCLTRPLLAEVYCDNCVPGICTRSNGTEVEAPRCLADPPPAHYGYEDCRNVYNCGGCIGWTCVVRDPEGEERRGPVLIPLDCKIETESPQPIPSDAAR